MYLFYQKSFLAVDEANISNHINACASQLPALIERLAGGAGPLAVDGISGDELLSHLTGNFLFVEAAGGAVRTSDNRWLLIYRNGRWDLPKGMVEKDEDIRTAAIREVAEETGLKEHTITSHLTDTLHIYNTYGQWTAKRTHWFVLKTDEPTIPIPQTAEGITRAEWLTTKERSKAMSESYSMMKYIDTLLTSRYDSQTI